MKISERLCIVLFIIGIILGSGGGFSVWIMVEKNMERIPVAFGIFVFGMILIVGSFFYGMEHYGDY